MADKTYLQTLTAQYTNGFLHAQPGQGYTPRSQPSGPVQGVYLEGYEDGQKVNTRHKLTEDSKFNCLEGKPENTDAARRLITHLRHTVAKIDSRIGSPTEIYRIQCEAADEFIQAELTRPSELTPELRAQLKSELLAELRAELAAK